MAELTGVVLAGGRSSRFGRDKLAEPVRGVPMLHHPILRLAEVCGEMVVVLAPGAPEPGLPGGVAVRVARDRVEGAGPLAGVEAGLRAVTTELALVVAGDMPELRVQVLRTLVRAAEEQGANAAALRDGDRVAPMPCVLSARAGATTAARLLEGGVRRFTDLLEALDPLVLDEDEWLALDPERRTLLDLDVPGDLDR